MNDTFCILIQISLKFVPKGPSNNKGSIDSGNALVPTNVYPSHWRIYTALGGDELIKGGLQIVYYPATMYMLTVVGRVIFQSNFTDINTSFDVVLCFFI